MQSEIEAAARVRRVKAWENCMACILDVYGDDVGPSQGERAARLYHDDLQTLADAYLSRAEPGIKPLVFVRDDELAELFKAESVFGEYALVLHDDGTASWWLDEGHDDHEDHEADTFAAAEAAANADNRRRLSPALGASERGEQESPGLVAARKRANHEHGRLFCWCVENLPNFPPMEGEWVDDVMRRLNPSPPEAGIAERVGALVKAVAYYFNANQLRCECSRVRDCGQCAVCHINQALAALRPAVAPSEETKQ